ncbi:hypothetical protein [Streptomyces sp. NPDC001348]
MKNPRSHRVHRSLAHSAAAAVIVLAAALASAAPAAARTAPGPDLGRQEERCEVTVKDSGGGGVLWALAPGAAGTTVQTTQCATQPSGGSATREGAGAEDPVPVS